MKYYTSVQTAEKLGISKRMVNIMCHDGRIPGVVKKGNRYMIPESYFDGKMGNEKRFNTEGACNRKIHYMVPISDRLIEVKKLIDSGKYFSVTKARQFGKTTMLKALEEILANDYIVISMDFQMQMSSLEFATESSFASAFLKAFIELARRFDNSLNSRNIEILLERQIQFGEAISMVGLFRIISEYCQNADRPVVLIIDEADSATNNQVFLDFLSQLRGYYLARDRYPIFQSVILAGVYDVKSLRRRLRPDDEHRENSPWNIAADFDVDMNFSAGDIEKMLVEYKNCSGRTFNPKKIAQDLFDYTDGYPYLVSRICKKIDEQCKDEVINEETVRTSVGLLLKEQNPLFEDIAKKLKDYPKLRDLLYGILFEGKVYPYNINAELIAIGTMFGFFKESEGQLRVANRIFEVWFYNLFISEEALSSEMYDAGLANKYSFVKENKLDMNLILQKFVEHFTEIYADYEDKFIEENGRRLFLMYICPIINGVGNYYIEARTRSMGRTDLILDYLGSRYIIEMKIWHGKQYNEEGEKQLLGYLSDYNVKRGYMLSFNFNKNKEVGVKEHHFKNATIVEAVV